MTPPSPMIISSDKPIADSSMPTNGPNEPTVEPSEPVVNTTPDRSNEINFYPLIHGFMPALEAMGVTQEELSVPSEPIVEVKESICSALDAITCLTASSPGQHITISITTFKDFTNVCVAQDGCKTVSPAVEEFVHAIWVILGEMWRHRTFGASALA
ncbi:hypothetical protein BOTBODRAFT_181734 [Botryobasidium botryosum FD-172 SS1]|uniref:Uncharacterized protein n=1 Tax=Botryobasidium botryosum (strain FD-172 SS1) TaxID=930990 RepID=A0A067M338_BOTB1|nr:hypothetical protein BOTBODRAFT_181734 [Botryobasidium botryosum FD-172 SS1]